MLPTNGTPDLARVVARSTVCLSLAALSACGPLRPQLPGPDPHLVAAADSAAATAAEIRERGAFPTEAAVVRRAVLYTEMLEDVELYRESSGGSLARTAQQRSLSERRRLALHRDTIRSRGMVLQWLERRREAGGDSIPFSLITEQVFRCDGAVLQYGRYRVPRRDAELMRVSRRHAVEKAWEVPFVARWRPSDGGSLQVEALWMGPLDREVNPVRLGDDCTATEEVAFARAYAQRRWAVEAGAGYTLQQAATGIVVDAATEQGWIGGLSRSASYWAELGVSWRIRPGWQVAGLASYQAPARVKQYVPPLYEATLDGTAVVVGGLLMAELGPVRLGAGPAVSFARWEWSDTDVTRPSTAMTSTLPGGLVEVGYVKTFQSPFFVHVRARYGFFPDAETPGFRDLGPVTVPMSGGRVSAGVGYWW